MLMSFSENKSRERWISEKLRGRTGHRVARLNDSVFVVGGVDGQGVQVNEIYRINCQNNRIDSLILDTSLPLEGFSLFSLQETLHIWGGVANSQYSNQLMQFDGSRFLLLKQTGQVPKPAANHLWATFGGKFLIIFGGNTQSQFLKDWYLLNIKTLEWRKLTPSLALNFCSGGQMVWLGGRGILLLNQVYDQQLKLYQPNQLYEFYVSDFNAKTLKIVPISVPSLSAVGTLVFTALVPLDKQSFLLLGGHAHNSIKETHNVCFKINPQLGHFEQLQLPLPSLLGFQPIFYKNSLYMIGGDSPKNEHYHGFLCYSFQGGERPYKRHVCEMCRLYFDEEWIQSTQQIYLNSTIREDYDYNYRMRMDNRVLQRFASYIRQQFYAFTLLLNCLKSLTAQEIDVSMQKIKDMNEDPQLIDQHYQYLKINCSVNESMLPSIINQILLEKQLQDSSDRMLDEADLSLAILRLKLGVFRLGSTALLVFRISAEEIFVIYYSSKQLQCTNTHFSPFPSYSYTYNLRTKTSSSTINRHIVHQNLKPIFKRHQDYQDIADFNLAIVIVCGDELQSELTLFQQSAELETGESSIVALKEERKTVPLIQLAFLPTQKMPPIFIEHNPLKFHNLYELMEGDQQNHILQPINPKDYDVKQNQNFFRGIRLFFHPEQYWFKRILVYHKGRLISHFRQPEKRLCGIIELQPDVQLDLGGTNLAKIEDKLIVERLLGQIQSLKRSKSN